MIVFPVRRKLWVVLAVSVGLFLVFSAIGERGFVRLKKMVNQRDELKARVHALEQSNREISEQVGRLRDDPATIEHLARTELGMVREGETVYIISDRPGDQPQ